MSLGIELRHLRNFIALAEELHFGRAAARCHITQPPFSVSIRQLENLLGYELVQRSSHEVRLTPAGAAYYNEANKVIAQLDYARRLANRVNMGLQGVLRLGFFASMLYRKLDLAMSGFSARYPDVELQLVELNTADQIPALLRNQIDYGFVHNEAFPPEIDSCILMSEPFVLCMPADHPEVEEPVSLIRFRDTPFVLFSRAFSPVYYDQVVSLCLAEGFHPEIKHEARHWLTVIACVAKGLGVTLIPESMIKGKFAGVRFQALAGKGVESVVRGAWRRENASDAALVAWREVVSETICAEGHPGMAGP